MSKILLEMCCYSVQSAMIAEKEGADRIELCTSAYEGGITPSYAAIEFARKVLKIPLNVIIRPRGADFYYSDIEFECMKRDIEICKSIGVDGIVSGLLLPDGRIDIDRTKELIELAKPLSFTFHRAFDMVENHILALEQLIELGADRILTSGGMQTANEGANLLKDLVELAKDRIIIMPGSGVDHSNIQFLLDITKAKELHCSAKSLMNSKMTYHNPNINMGGENSISEFEYYEADSEKIRKIVSILKAEDH